MKEEISIFFDADRNLFCAIGRHGQGEGPNVELACRDYATSLLKAAGRGVGDDTALKQTLTDLSREGKME